MRKVETRTIYVCDRCGKESDQSYCIIDVHLPDDLSVAGEEYHFCKQCYEEIHSLMKDKNQVIVPFSIVKDYFKKLIDNAPEKQYVPIYYPVYYPRDWWNPSYPKVPYTTTTTTTCGSKEGISISAKNISDTNVVKTTTKWTDKINDVDITTCCCDGVRRD